MAKSNEPIWWSLFSAGGVVSALLTPALIIITGLALPYINAGKIASISPVAYDQINALASNIIGRLFLLAVIALPLFHWAHRFRYTVFDLGVHGARTFIAVLCYGAAIVGTLFAAYLVVTL